MLVIAIENAPPKLRGYLSSWSLQVSSGVYVANLPKRIREEIWATVERWSTARTSAVMIWSANTTEQGLDYCSIGTPRRAVRRIEGLLVSVWIPNENTYSKNRS